MGEEQAHKEIKQLCESFFSRLDALQEVIPFVSVTVAGWELNTAKKDRDYLQQFEKLDKNSAAQLQSDQLYEISRRLFALNKVGQATNICHRSLLIGAFALYDGFVTDLVRFILVRRDDLAIFGDKEIKLQDVLRYQSIESLKLSVIEREVGRVLRESYDEQFRILGNMFGLKLGDGLEIMPAFVEASQRRHLIVHANGRVSEQYLIVCKRHNVNWPSNEPKIGDELSVDKVYLVNVCEILHEVALKLAHSLVRKVLPSMLEQTDLLLASHLYRLLEAERFATARMVGKYATSLPRYSQDDIRRRLAVNYAQSLKWLGSVPDCNAVLDGFDWSATDEAFKIAVAVLKDDFDGAANLMRKVGPNPEWKLSYREWPLFREFRKSPRFLQTYEEIYSESFAANVQKESAKISQQLANMLNGLSGVISQEIDDALEEFRRNREVTAENKTTDRSP